MYINVIFINIKEKMSWGGIYPLIPPRLTATVHRRVEITVDEVIDELAKQSRRLEVIL